MHYYDPPAELADTVFDPSSDTFGPIMAALQAGDFEIAATLTATLATWPTAEARADAEALAPHDFGRTPGERALAVLITDPAIRAHIDPKALAQARAGLGLVP